MVDWGGVASDTGQGAATGSVFGPWGAAVGAGIGFVGGIMGSNSANAQAKLRNMWLGRAWKMGSPKRIMALSNMLLPYERNMIATAAGPQLQQNIAGNIAARGLSGTGLGLAMQNAGLVAPGMMAAQNSLSTAIGIRQNQANMALSIAGQAQVKTNPLAGGLMGAARGAFAMGGSSGGTNNAVFSDPNVAFPPGSTNSMSGSLPNLYPSISPGGPGGVL